MRKFLSGMLALLMVVSLFGLASAQERRDANVLTLCIPNSATAANLQTLVNATNETSGIVPGVHRILGYEVCAYAGIGIPQVALLDNSSMTNTTNITYTQAAGLFAESAAPVAGGSVYREFPYPKALSKALVVSQSNATIVNIYYERYVP